MSEKGPKMSDREKAVALYQFFKWPTIVFSLACGVSFGLVPTGEWILFSNHPFFMTIACVGIPICAALIKKIGGLENTVLHGNLLSLAILLMFAGYTAIYLNKERAGKEHLQTNHAWLGVTVLACWIGSATVGTVALHPQYGMYTTNKWIRTVHKWFSRSILLASWVACYLGLATIQSNVYYQVAFVLPLVYSSYYVLL